MADSKMTIASKLVAIQTELKAPKNLYNSFGKYSYRNAEGIQEALKPLLKKYGVFVILSDDISEVGGRIYVKATAKLQDAESSDSIEVTAFAREAVDKKGMDDAQITGATSSYARKYALNGLFLLDDTKDADTDEYHEQTQPSKPQKPVKKTQAVKKQEFICKDCGQPINDAEGHSAELIVANTEKKFGRRLCMNCAHEAQRYKDSLAKQAQEAQQMPSDEEIELPFEIKD